jgi:hypothetical protein
LGELRRNRLPDNNSADKLVDAVKILFQDAGSTPAASTSRDLEFSQLSLQLWGSWRSFAQMLLVVHFVPLPKQFFYKSFPIP